MLFLEEIAAAKRNIKLQVFASDIDADAWRSPATALSGIDRGGRVAGAARPLLHQGGPRLSGRARVARGGGVHGAGCAGRRAVLAPRPRLLPQPADLSAPRGAGEGSSLFHFALREGGVLFLGASETVGSLDDRFEPISKKQRIYRHIGHSRPGEVEFPIGPGARRASALAGTRRTRRRRGGISARRPLAAALLDAYAPASVLINAKHEGLYYFGADRPLSEGRRGRGEPGCARHGARGAAHQAPGGDPAGRARITRLRSSRARRSSNGAVLSR